MSRNATLVLLLLAGLVAAGWFLFSRPEAPAGSAEAASAAAAGSGPAAADALEGGAGDTGAAGALDRSESAPPAGSGGAAALSAAGESEILLRAVDHAARPAPGAWAIVSEDLLPEGPGGLRIVPPGIDGAAGAAPRTDASADGRVRLRAPAQRPLALEVGGDGHQSRTLALQPLRPGETLDLGEVALLAGATVAGRVLDPAGRPVPGARVALRPQAQRGFPFGGRNGEAGAGGEFRFTGVEPGSYLLEAEAPGFAPARGDAGARIEAKAGETGADATLRLLEGRSLSGLVVDADRRPIEGAEVFLRSQIRGGPFVALSGGAAGRAPDAVTDPAGRFTLRGVDAAATTRVSARAPGYGLAWASANAQVAEILIVLKPALRLAGTVEHPDGQPAAGVEVRLVRAEGEDAGFSFLSLFDDHAATSGADGRFAIEGLDPGLWSVRAASGGLSAQGLQMDLLQDVEDYLVRLGPAAVLTVRVTRDGDGAPLADALVTLTPVEAQDGFGGPPGQVRRDVRVRIGGPGGGASVDLGGDEQRQRTDDDGAAHFADLPQQRYALRAEAAGHATHQAEVTRERGMQELAITLLPGADLLVRVEDGAGLPLPGVDATATPTDPALEGKAEPRTQRTDASGRAVFAGMPPGVWSVDYRASAAAGAFRFAGPGFGAGEPEQKSHSAQPVVLAAGAVQEVVLRATGLCLPTVVVTRRGVPLAGALVRTEAARAEAFAPPLPGFGGERTDAGGRVRLQPVEPGPYEVVVAPGNGLPERREKADLAAGEQRIEVDVRGGRVSGVAEIDGRAAANATARLEPAPSSGAGGGGRPGGRRGVFIAVTDDGGGPTGGELSFGGPSATSTGVDGRGNFIFEEVPPGEYVVRVSASGYAPWTSQKFALAGEESRDVGAAQLLSGGVIQGLNRRAQAGGGGQFGGNGFLLLNDANGGSAGFAPVGADGSYAFRDLAAGSYTIFQPPDWRSEPIEVKAGQTVTFDVPK